jgi:uncharacterized protein YggE
MPNSLSTVCFLILCVANPSLAAQSRGDSVRKTIEIQANGKVEVAAEIATVKIGYANEAATKDAAYAENTRVSQKIVRALLDGHVPAAAIQSQSLNLGREEEQGGGAPSRVVKFSALQEWRVHVAAADAQKVVDIAVAGGATNVGGVEWDVKDPDGLEAQAYAAAMEHAKQVAGQTASNAGIKLGDILSVQNFSGGFGFGSGVAQTVDTEIAEVSSTRFVATVPLTLYPPKIERQATVKVTYAIAP